MKRLALLVFIAFSVGESRAEAFALPLTKGNVHEVRVQITEDDLATLRWIYAAPIPGNVVWLSLDFAGKRRGLMLEDEHDANAIISDLRDLADANGGFIDGSILTSVWEEPERTVCEQSPCHFFACEPAICSTYPASRHTSEVLVLDSGQTFR